MKTKNLIKTATLLITFLCIGFLMQSCQEKSKSLTQSEMDGYWVLKTINGHDSKTAFEGALPTLQFNFKDSIVSGTGGCNRYHGSFTYKKGIFAAPNLAVTKMLCTEKNLEGQFLLELSNVNNKLSIVDGLLTVSHDGKVVLQFEKGSEPNVEGAKILSPEFLSGTWKLFNISGEEAASKFGADQTKIPTLAFNFQDNKITGNSGCNMYNAKFSLDKNTLVVGPIMSTRMACPNLEGEAQFTQAISDTSIITMPDANVLQFAKGGNVLLEFHKTQDASATPVGH